MIKNVLYSFCCICNSLAWFYILSINIKRVERALRQFYLPLRDEHPKEYVKQSRLIKFVRRHTRLSVYDRIHWVYSILHYLQVILVLGTPLIVTFGFFETFEMSLKMYMIFWLVTVFIFTLFADIFGCVQATRCSKIKKGNPKYKKCDVLRWKH